jgi:diguanylate cyclase (GGDEF)-like protein
LSARAALAEKADMSISIDTLVLIQDIQLLCFTLVFGILAWQRWSDPTKRWVFYSFLANCLGAAIDLSPVHLPRIVSQGIDPMTFSLSYAVLNIAFVHFERRARIAIWISAGLLLLSFPLFVAWSSNASPVRSNSLGDLMIAAECFITPAILLTGKERSTRAPRLLMGGFFVVFALVEFVRAWVAFGLHRDPDSAFQKLVFISAVSYIVNVSMLPLGVIWMMNSRLEAELQQQIVVDPLTNVYNRRGFTPALDRELAHYKRYREDFSLVLFDLDHFKQLNDTYGHAAGDTVLAAVAETVRTRLRETDVIARLGGEEFLILLPRTTLAATQLTVELLHQAIREKRHMLSGNPVQVTASWGITSTSECRNANAERLLSQADTALYRAKKSGRDRVCTYSPDDFDYAEAQAR